MLPVHKEILGKIKRKTRRETFETPSYLGHRHIHYGLSVPQQRGIAKEWAQEHKDISFHELLTLLDVLFKGTSYEEKTIGNKILLHFPKFKTQIPPEKLDNWLDELEGWGEIDSLCQSTFSAEEMLNDWKTWKKVLLSLNKSKNLNKKRASLVLLTGPVRESDDARFSHFSFQLIDSVKSHKEIIITKAISWLLRSLIKNHTQQVEEYITKHKDSLPKIAIRETSRKLKTGRK